VDGERGPALVVRQPGGREAALDTLRGPVSPRGTVMLTAGST
jgi:hypothetical protein